MKLIVQALHKHSPAQVNIFPVTSSTPAAFPPATFSDHLSLSLHCISLRESLYSSCFKLSLLMSLTPIASLNTPPSNSSVYPKAFPPLCFQFHLFFWRPPLHLPKQYFIFIKITLHFLSLTPSMAVFLATLLFPMEPCQVQHSCCIPAHGEGWAS